VKVISSNPLPPLVPCGHVKKNRYTLFFQTCTTTTDIIWPCYFKKKKKNNNNNNKLEKVEVGLLKVEASPSPNLWCPFLYRVSEKKTTHDSEKTNSFFL
jgi:hypothetical protein